MLLLGELDFFPDTRGFRKNMINKSLINVVDKGREWVHYYYYNNTWKIVEFPINYHVIRIATEKQLIIITGDGITTTLQLITHNQKPTDSIENYIYELCHTKIPYLSYERITLKAKVREIHDLVINVIENDLISIPDLVYIK